MVRSILAVIAGIVVGGLLISSVEMFSSRLYPLPAGVNPSDTAAMMEHLPAGAFGWVLVAWAIGTLSGAWVAARIGRRKPLVYGMVIGSVFLILGVVNMIMLPHPIWVWIAGIVIFLGCGYAGGLLASRRVSA